MCAEWKHVWRPASCLERPQSAAVVLLNTSTCAGDTSNAQLLQRLWNQAAFRACADGAANAIFEQRSIWKPPDLVAGDFDSIRSDVRKFYDELEGTAVVHTPDQDHTDFTKIVRLINQWDKRTQTRPTCIVAVGGLCGRFDHVLSALHTLALCQCPQLGHLPLLIVDGRSLVWRLPQGEHTIETDAQYLSGTCGFVPLEGPAHSVTTDGLKWNLEAAAMDFSGGLVSTCNRFQSPLIRIKCDQALFATFELVQNLPAQGENGEHVHTFHANTA